MTHTLRLFFALEISPLLHKTITNVVQRLKEKDVTYGVRWIAPENWHLTVCFLGTVLHEKIDFCLEQVEKSLQTSKPFEFTLGKLSVFPRGHPRMLIIQIPTSEGLTELHATVKNALIAGGFEQEKRAFFPHITLGKFSGNFPFALDNIIIPKVNQRVGEVVLFSSKAAAGGSIYTVVRRLGM